MRIRRDVLLGPALDEVTRDRRARALDLAEAALAAIEPEAATARALAGRADLQGCTVLAFGKAAVPMARAALRCCAPRGGLVVALAPADLGPLEVRLGEHPRPALDAPATGRAALELVRSLGADDVLLCLVSGGGSALLELPAAGVTIEQIRATTEALLRGSVPIGALNAARTRLSALKGGQLARATQARIVNLVLSDVPGQPASVVASGPTVADEARIRTTVVADNDTAVAGVLARAAERGIVLERAAGLVGEARDAGRRLVRDAAGAFAMDPRIDGFVAGGETTVTVTGDGDGGRNGELVLGAADVLSSHLVLALATDGVDGGSRSAGALLDPAALEGARGSIAQALEDNDSAPWLRRAGTLLETGPTGTNVADVALVLR